MACNLKTKKLLDFVFIGVCAVTGYFVLIGVCAVTGYFVLIGVCPVTGSGTACYAYFLNVCCVWLII